MTTDGPYISKTFGSASPRGRREVVSTVDRGVPTNTVDDNRNSGLRRLKSRSWGSIRRWEKENELLFAMIEDESEWLAELFPDEIIAPEFFFFALEDGVLLCKLANLIQEYAEQYGKENNIEIPKCRLKYHPRNKTRGQLGQFRARENVTSFLGWCRKHHIPEVILFESNDVVQTEDLREGAREVVICLMEVARRSFKYGVKPPKLIILEKEIDEEERTDSLGSPNSIDSGVGTDTGSAMKCDTTLIDSETYNGFSSSDCVEIKSARSSVTEWKDDRGSQYNSDKTARVNGVYDVTNKEYSASDQTDNTQKPQSELDRKVLSLVEEYSVGKILRLKEGKYIILGRVMFVRMLNEHVLVRIGGGWDGLEHYLMTHVKQGSQSQNPPSTPATNAVKTATPISRPDTRRTNKPLSPAASNNSLAEGKKDEFRTFSPSLQVSLVARGGRESPLRKTSRVKDADEADIARAIRRIENTVSENIQRKTNSYSTLELSTSTSNCRNCSSNRRPGSRKMAAPEIQDASSTLHENGEFQKLENNSGNVSNIQGTMEGLLNADSSDENDRNTIEGEVVVVVNGDVVAQEDTKHLLDDVEKFASNENCMNVVVTKKEVGQQKTDGKKAQGTQKRHVDSKGMKTQSKSATSVKSVTAATKAPSKIDKKAVSATKKPTATKSAVASTTANAKPTPKSGTDKKPGAVKTSSSKPIFKVSTSTTATSSAISEPKSVPGRAALSKSAPASSKSIGTKSSVTKSTSVSTSGKHTPGKPAPKASAATIQTSAKSDEKSKKEVKTATGSHDSADGSIVFSAKSKGNSGSKAAAQAKLKSDPHTPKAASTAKNATSAKAKPAKTNTKLNSVCDAGKSMEKKAADIGVAKTTVTNEVSSKPSLATRSGLSSKSDSAVKKLASGTKSKKAVAPSATKALPSTGKDGESSKKATSANKPASAPAKPSSAAKSSKPSAKPSSAPPAASKSTVSASKTARSTTRTVPSTTTAHGDKKSTTSKTKALRSTGDKGKAPPAVSKASAANVSKELKTAKQTSGKSAKVEKKGTKKDLKNTVDKNKEPREDAKRDLVPMEAAIVEQKETTIVEASLPTHEDQIEVCVNDIPELAAAQDSNGTVSIEAVSAEHELSAVVEPKELIATDIITIDSESEPSKFEAQIDDSTFQQKGESFLQSRERDDNSNNLLETKDIEVKAEAKSTLEEMDIQPEFKENKFEDGIIDREDQRVLEQRDVTDDGSLQEVAELSPTVTETKGNNENVISASKMNRSDTYDIIEDGKEKISCEEEDDTNTKEDSEEQDSESAMFDESKLISLEEITAKCDEDDVREGAVAPTPPETPVPETINVEMEHQSEVSLEVTSIVEQSPLEPDFGVSGVVGDIRDIEMRQSSELPFAVTDNDTVPKVSAYDDELQKDSVGPDFIGMEMVDSKVEVMDACEQDVGTDLINDSMELVKIENKSDVKDSVNIEVVESAGEGTNPVAEVHSEDFGELGSHGTLQDEHEAIHDVAMEIDKPTMLSQSSYVDYNISNDQEALEVRDICANQMSEIDSQDNQSGTISHNEAGTVAMDTDLTDDTLTVEEIAVVSNRELSVGSELLGEIEAPINSEVSANFEVKGASDISQENDVVSPLSSDFTSSEVQLDEVASPSERGELFFIGSKGTEELMQRESAGEETGNDSVEPVGEELAEEVQNEPEEEERDDENFEEEKEELANGANVESYDVSVNDVSINVMSSHEQGLLISPVDHETGTPESSVYDSAFVSSGTEGMGPIIAEQGYSNSCTIGDGDDVMITADAAQNEICSPDIGLQENGSEGEKTPNAEEYNEEPRSEEDEDSKDDTLKALDLEPGEGDSAFTEDQFTPISDLPDDMRSPLTKDSFSHFASGDEDECEYENRSDGDGEGFDRGAIEHAKESVRVARSLDDSCEEEKPDVRSLDDSCEEEKPDLKFQVDDFHRFDDNIESGDQELTFQGEASFQSPVVPQDVHRFDDNIESEDQGLTFQDEASFQAPVVPQDVHRFDDNIESEDQGLTFQDEASFQAPVVPQDVNRFDDNIESGDQGLTFQDEASFQAPVVPQDVHRFDDNIESGDQGLTFQDEASFQAPVVPQVVSSPCISSEGEEFEEGEFHEGDSTSGFPADDHASDEKDLQDSSIGMHQTDFPADFATTDTLRDLYRADAQSHDLQLGYEKQLYVNQITGAQFPSDDGNADTVELEAAGLGMVQDEEPGANSYSDGKELQDREQDINCVPLVGQIENVPDGDAEEEIADTAQEALCEFGEAAHCEVGKDMETYGHEDGSGKESSHLAQNVLQGGDCDGQYADGGRKTEFVGEEKLGEGMEIYYEEGKGEDVVTDVQFEDSENTSFEEMEKSLDESPEFYSKNGDEIGGISIAEDDEKPVQGSSCEEQYKSDVERNVHSDDQTTDGSDFVLLDSPVKHQKECKTYEMAPDHDTDTKVVLQTSVNESEPGDSPFHHIELKPDEAKEEEEPDVNVTEVLPDFPSHDEDVLNNEKFYANHSFGENFGTNSNENQVLPVSNLQEEQNTNAFSEVEFSQTSNPLWKADMHEEDKHFLSDGFSNPKNHENQTQLDSLVSESLNTGPRYVYDASDDEDVGEDDEDDGDDDETY